MPARDAWRLKACGEREHPDAERINRATQTPERMTGAPKQLRPAVPLRKDRALTAFARYETIDMEPRCRTTAPKWRTSSNFGTWCKPSRHLVVTMSPAHR